MTVVRTSERVHSGLRRLAERRRCTMSAVLEELVERAEAEEFWGSFGDYMETEPGLLEDPETRTWLAAPAPVDGAGH